MQARVDAIFTTTSLPYNLRDRVIAATLPRHVPVVGHRGPLAEAGALFSYGASLSGQIRASAKVVDRILRGARPAEMPVQQPTVFEFWVNLRSARALGLRPPQTVLLRADRLIE